MATFPEIPTEELPYWMRQARRGIDWGLLIVLGFSLLLVWPFIIRSGLSPANANRSYVFRTADYAQTIMEGRLYPRWSPNTFGGYGAPIPNFYPPGGPYTAAVLQVLFTGDAVRAVRIAYIVAYCAAGCFIYLFISRRSSAAAGIMGSMVYLYQPYIGLTVPHIQGDLPLALALALLPALLWAADRLLRLNRPFDILLTALGTAGLFITHVPMGVAGALLVFVMVIWQHRIRRKSPHYAVLLTALLSGILLAGFFWIPALLEQNAITWRPAVAPSDTTLTLPGLFTPLYPLDPLELRPQPQLTLGIVGIIISLGSAASILYFRRFTHFETLFLGMGVVLTLVVVSFVPRETWLLVPVALCLAVSSSAILWFTEKLRKRRGRVLLPALLITTWMASVPMWSLPDWPETLGGNLPIDQIQFEQIGYGAAVLPPDEPIPATIPLSVPVSSFLIDGFRTGAVNRISPQQSLTSIQTGLLAHGTHTDIYQIHTSVPASLTILTAYFPGWMAFLDNRAVTLTRQPDNGLIQVNIPAADRSELLITLGTTPIRTRAWSLSGLAVALLGIITWGRWRRQKPNYSEFKPLPRAEIRLVALVLICCSVILGLFAIRPSALRASPGYRIQDSILTNSRTNSGLSILGYHLNYTAVGRGQSVSLAIYWETRLSLLKNYRVKVYLLSTHDGTRWSETDYHHPGDYPTRLWPINRYVTDTYRLTIPPDIQPGQYDIAIEVSECEPDCASGKRLTFFDNTGQIVGPILTLPNPILVGR